MDTSTMYSDALNTSGLVNTGLLNGGLLNGGFFKSDFINSGLLSSGLDSSELSTRPLATTEFAAKEPPDLCQPFKCRKIIHVDMDAFFASVEQRDNPELRGKPVVVGGKPSGRGVVCAASYEARKFGIRSAMPSHLAYDLCPHAIFVPPRFDAYKEVSREIMSIFREYTDVVEALSLDEAYLDVTENKKGLPLARDVAKEIREKILARTKLTASAGVAPNKFLAKLASDMKKPDALVVISPPYVEKAVAVLPVVKLPGVGKVTEAKMHQAHLFTTRDIREHSPEYLISLFGKHGAWYYEIAHGRDTRPVTPYRERKSVGAEDTFSGDILDVRLLNEKLHELSEKVSSRLKSHGGYTVTLKVTYQGFRKITRSKSFEHRVVEKGEILHTAQELLKLTDAGEVPIRLLGISVSGFKEKETRAPMSPQLTLFDSLSQ